MNLVYDANGNMVTGDGFYREYNSLNQLWKVRLSNSTGIILENYIYDPVEEKVLLKNVSYNNGTWKETVYYWFDEYVEVNNASGWFNFTYVEHEGQRIAEMRGNTAYYVLGDALGSSTVITNASGNLTEQSSYTPFGSQINSTIQSRYSYTGQEFDSVIGDYDYHARRYKADWGKFLQADTLIASVYNPQDLNRYSYVNNNPWRFTDPTGHCPGCLLTETGFGYFPGNGFGYDYINPFGGGMPTVPIDIFVPIEINDAKFGEETPISTQESDSSSIDISPKEVEKMKDDARKNFDDKKRDTFWKEDGKKAGYEPPKKGPINYDKGRAVDKKGNYWEFDKKEGRFHWQDKSDKYGKYQNIDPDGKVRHVGRSTMGSLSAWIKSLFKPQPPKPKPPKAL